MNKNIIRICALMMVFSLISLAFTACGGKQYEQIGETPVPTTQKPDHVIVGDEDVPEYNPLSGEKMDANAIKQYVAVMIDGESEITGLSSPDLIFEGITEGNKPEMMWVYADLSKMPVIGSVAKASHNLVEIAGGMGAVLVHNGATSRGAYAIEQLEMPCIDAEKEFSAFTNSENGVNTNGNLIKSIIESKGYNKIATVISKKPFNVISGKDLDASGNQAGGCKTVKVFYNTEAYQYFEYNEETDKYVNEQGLEVDNVIVMYCNYEAYDGGQDWMLENGGGLWISDGTGKQISWTKNGANNSLSFSNKETGVKLVVNEGTTFVCVIPTANRAMTKITTK